jgi:hypothetical protein
MNCHDVQQALIDALYGELSASARHEVEAHRARCATCAEAWTSLHTMRQALSQWTEVAPPPGLRERILAQVAARRRVTLALPWWRWGLVSTGVSVAAGLAMMVLTVLLLAHALTIEALSPRVLLICGSLWGGSYIGLFRLTMSEMTWGGQPWLSGRGPLASASSMALLAIAIATLLLALLTALPLASLLGSLATTPWLPMLSAAAVALVALAASGWYLRPVLGARGLRHALLAACLFVLAVAPGLLIVCVPLTLSVYAGLLLAVGVGAGTGGMLGMRLSMRHVH